LHRGEVILDSTHLLFPSRSLLISSLAAPTEPLDAGDLFDGMNKRAAGASGEDRISDLPDGGPPPRALPAAGGPGREGFTARSAPSSVWRQDSFASEHAIARNRVH
jgi:hypothetical protein